MADAHDLAFGRNAEGSREATLDVLLVVLDDHDRNLHQLVRTIRVAIPEAAYTETLKNGVTLRVEVDAPAKSARVRVIVHDIFSGSVGSVDVPLTLH